QPEVLHVLASDKVKDQVTRLAPIQPRLVGLDARSAVAHPLVGSAVPQVDDPAVVILRLPRAIALLNAVATSLTDQPVVTPDIVESAIVLGESCAASVQLVVITRFPELAHQFNAARTLRGVELPENRIWKQDLEVFPVVIQRRAVAR